MKIVLFIAFLGTSFYPAIADGSAWLTFNLGENIADVHIDYPIPTDDHTAQDITYTYDAVGNITQITDASETDAAKTMDYGYDDLYRITSASSTNAASDDYAETYSYDSIGNITSKSDIGTYLYQETDYANPHAATSVNGQTYTYDNNGNVTSDGTLTLTWDYRNRLVSASSSSATSTYAYNHENQRVKLSTASSTTIYPNKLYNTDGTTETKHIFDSNGDVIATIETENSASSTYYVHTDHLTGSNVVTDENGHYEQLMDYFPFGEIRINDTVGDFDEQRKFTGQEYDEEINLHYFIQRYYNQDIGRFTSQDPVFLNLGVDQRTGKVLENPQLHNSYNYVANNPLKYVDEEGELPILIPILVIAAIYAPAVLPSLPALFDNPDITARMTPGLGDALDVGEAVSGRDAFTGQKLSGFERTLSAGSAFLPGISGGQFRAVKHLVKYGGGEAPVYRGGADLTARSIDVKIDPHTGNVLPWRGPSVNVNPNDPNVVKYGGAYRIDSLPEGLKITNPTGKEGHFEIVPEKAVSIDAFNDLLKKVKKTKVDQ